MRALLALVLATGCATSAKPGVVGSTRPGVIPMLSELPADAGKRDAILDSGAQVAGPEHRKGMTRKERKVETGAATLAAILGSAFSTTPNVTLGGAATFDETGNLGRKPPTRPMPQAAGTASDVDDTGELPEKPTVPWIQLRPVPGSTTK